MENTNFFYGVPSASDVFDKIREVDRIYGIKPCNGKAKPEERICTRIMRDYQQKNKKKIMEKQEQDKILKDLFKALPERMSLEDSFFLPLRFVTGVVCNIAETIGADMDAQLLYDELCDFVKYKLGI